jgi:DNA-binding NtrC family response regulator
MQEKNILIVDDDIDILGSFKQILELEGYKIDTAECAEDGIEKVKENFYNLALLDIKLPDMEGTDLLVVIHKLRPGIMKIMVTGYAAVDNAVLCLNRGADAFLLKPIEPEKLIDVVKEKLEEQEEAEKLSEEKVTEWLESRLLKLK